MQHPSGLRRSFLTSPKDNSFPRLWGATTQFLGLTSIPKQFKSSIFLTWSFGQFSSGDSYYTNETSWSDHKQSSCTPDTQNPCLHERSGESGHVGAVVVLGFKEHIRERLVQLLGSGGGGWGEVGRAAQWQVLTVTKVFKNSADS